MQILRPSPYPLPGGEGEIFRNSQLIDSSVLRSVFHNLVQQWNVFQVRRGGLERADIRVNVLGLPVGHRVFGEIRHACRRSQRRDIGAGAKETYEILFAGEVRTPVSDEGSPGLAVVPVATIAAIRVIQSFSVSGVARDRTRGLLAAVSAAALRLGGHHDQEEQHDYNIRLHVVPPYRGCVITSIMYGSPRFTESRPRLKAAPSFDGSEIGPSEAIP